MHITPISHSNALWYKVDQGDTKLIDSSNHKQVEEKMNRLDRGRDGGKRVMPPMRGHIKHCIYSVIADEVVMIIVHKILYVHAFAV